MSPIRITLAAALTLAVSSAAQAKDFYLFETGQVRPLALSPDGSRLFAVNTPDGRLEIFDVEAHGLVHTASVQVGLEPCAVAARTNDEVWVVNHLSDSVSIVDVPTERVTRTLLVGDEPNDIVFAGPAGDRAFISTAHRGQSSPFPLGESTTAGAGRADVWVFDATSLGAGLGGDALTVVTLFGDKPRALAANADGSRVYAAVFHSGNQTTAINDGLVCNGGSGAGSCGLDVGTAPGGLPAPNANHEGTTGPETGLIVRHDGVSWVDELGRVWDDAVRFDLPDLDVFEIDANAAPPVELASFAAVGTIHFNMIVNPSTGKVYVSGTEARNEVRFEGPGTVAALVKPPGEPASVRGHLHEARITVLDGASVLPRHLNKHIDYGPGPAAFTGGGDKDDSLATPLGMALTSDGGTLYVAAFGSSAVGVFSTADLESDAFVPDDTSHIPVSGGGPTGVALDEANARLYVLTRFNNAVVEVSTTTELELASHSLHHAEPPHVVTGRPFLYDADLTSSNGEASCSSCHVFGDMDDLAWDLGNPDGDVESNPNPFPVIGPGGPEFHPHKGPMTTQTLRGLDNHGPMHWRGDRTGGNAVPPVSPLSEDAAFNAFNVAFDGLLGRDEGMLPTGDMQSFTDFALEITSPPNPIRQLDNSLRADEAAGAAIFNGQAIDIIATCEGCHELDAGSGFFGAGGGSSFEGETQEFKVPHLRNLYQKVGMFGMPAAPFFLPGNNGSTGNQIRGFGFLHDGSTDTVFRFLSAQVFPGFANDTAREQVEAFMLAFDSTFAPIVGQQITRSSTNGAVVDPRIDLMIQRASTGFALVGDPGAFECDLIAKGIVSGEPRGALYNPASGNFLTDSSADPPGGFAENVIRNLSNTPGQETTYTCAPPGTGTRMGIDRDLDAVLDLDDTCPTSATGDHSDVDSDGLGAVCDNCRLVGNADQLDVGGLGAGGPDDIGNVCQCGDANQDGFVTSTDAFAIVACLNPMTPCPVPGGVLDVTIADANNDGFAVSTDAFIIVTCTTPGSCTAPGGLVPSCARRPEQTLP